MGLERWSRPLLKPELNTGPSYVSKKGTIMRYPEGALERLQQVELDIMLKIDAICRSEGITYFLHSGTCLGAVRHKGFIPWDDDIDIGMPLEDYRRFQEIAPKLLPEGYSLHTLDNTPNFPTFFTKVFKDGTRFIDAVSYEAGYELGIFVDIFPFIQIDARPEVEKRQLRSLDFWKNVMYLRYIAHPHLPKKTPLKPLVHVGTSIAHAILSRTADPKKLRDHFERNFHTDCPSDRWMNACYLPSGICPGSILFPPIEMEFEGHMLYAPADPHAKMVIEYGDYMQLPPEEDRYTHAPVILDFGGGVNVMEQTSR